MHCRTCWSNFRSFLLVLLTGGALYAQVTSNETPAPAAKSGDALSHIEDRLDALERENAALLSEIQALRKELEAARPTAAAPATPVEERLNVAEQRIKEQAQTKVEASEKFPITLTGMLLFDAYRQTGYAAYGSYTYGGDRGPAGATLSQSIIGLDFHGPTLPGGGQVHGFLSMDFYSELRGYSVFRLRQGVVSFDWKRRSISFGQEKPLVAPLQPTSFARVGTPPLAGAGNLWLWQPQVRYEERISFGPKTEVALQAAVLETNETYATANLPANTQPEPARPAIQARIGVTHSWQEQKRLSAGLAFHESSTHILGTSVPSRLISADFLFKPFSKFELSGTLFHGKNFSNLGGAPPGFAYSSTGAVIAVRGSGGWIQLAFPVTRRLTFDLYGGRQLNNANDLNDYDLARTFTYAGNALYRIAPNIVLGFEISQSRLDYIDLHQALSNRYDATVAYLF